jgi:sulfur carrier protein ThiS
VAGLDVRRALLSEVTGLIITTYLHTILQKLTPNGPVRSVELTMPEGSIVADVIAQLEIKIDPADMLITVNGQIAEESKSLFPGDRVDLIPAISGGAGL